MTLKVIERIGTALTSIPENCKIALFCTFNRSSDVIKCEITGKLDALYAYFVSFFA
jgi:hypothetical protein